MPGTYWAFSTASFCKLGTTFQWLAYAGTPLCTCISIKFLEAELLVKRCVHLNLWDTVKLTSRELIPIYILYIYIYIYIYIYSPREGTGYTFQYSCLDSSIPPWIEEYIYTDIGHAAQYARWKCGILVPQPGIKPMPSAVEARSLTNWTAKEIPSSCQLTCLFPPHTCQHVIIKSVTI